MKVRVSTGSLSITLCCAAALFGNVGFAAPPDILGVTVGMSPADAYNAVKAADPNHRVAVSQVLIPELLGDKPAVFRMQPDTQDTANVFYVNVTTPPNPQAVWQVYHFLGQLHVTRQQALDSLLNKYGAKYRSRTPFGPNDSVGTFRWIYDEQGNLSDMPFSKEGNCARINGLMDPLHLAGYTQPGVTKSPEPAVQLREIPPLMDPATMPECQHLVWVEATLQGVGLLWNITVTITGWDLQHRSAIAFDNHFNALAQQRQDKEINQAQHTAVPKL